MAFSYASATKPVFTFFSEDITESPADSEGGFKFNFSLNCSKIDSSTPEIRFSDSEVSLSAKFSSLPPEVTESRNGSEERTRSG